MGPDSILAMDVPGSGYGAGPAMLLTRQHAENLEPKKIAEAFCDPRCALSSSAPPDLGHLLAAVHAALGVTCRLQELCEEI